ncbi:hypothetical protein LRS10_04145 [Phenylobacterium sp. J426]|uniref:hypothetical protein n=1 Tax=Phenylobacterium sp. J426 TaxID=2898439 RepID=UPI002150F8F9|nr:hypothetical protein [Phenylobacterium sp. J426]MCR5873450.1 hypothetical protein [Phenylobacterium sp. J426]
MRLERPDAVSAGPQRAARRDISTLYWVIGGCWGDETRTWRRWSEVVGPFADREPAEAMRRRLEAIWPGDAHVHFSVVRCAEAE